MEYIQYIQDHFNGRKCDFVAVKNASTTNQNLGEYTKHGY